MLSSFNLNTFGGSVVISHVDSEKGGDASYANILSAEIYGYGLFSKVAAASIKSKVVNLPHIPIYRTIYSRTERTHSFYHFLFNFYNRD